MDEQGVKGDEFPKVEKHRSFDPESIVKPELAMIKGGGRYPGPQR